MILLTDRISGGNIPIQENIETLSEFDHLNRGVGIMVTNDALQERVDALEQTSRTHDVMLNLLISIGERQQETLERQEAMLEEIHRDARQTQRLWVRLAQRYGWLDDDEQ